MLTEYSILLYWGLSEEDECMESKTRFEVTSLRFEDDPTTVKVFNHL